MAVMELAMPRRKIAQDEPEGRKHRVRAFSIEEIQRIAAELQELSQQCTSLVSSMEKDGIESVQIDGAEKPYRALDLLTGWASSGETAYRQQRRRI